MLIRPVNRFTLYRENALGDPLKTKKWRGANPDVFARRIRNSRRSQENLASGAQSPTSLAQAPTPRWRTLAQPPDPSTQEFSSLPVTQRSDRALPRQPRFRIQGLAQGGARDELTSMSLVACAHFRARCEPLGGITTRFATLDAQLTLPNRGCRGGRAGRCGARRGLRHREPAGPHPDRESSLR